MKTIIIQKYIPHYRFIFFTLLSKKVDLIVVHSDPKFDSNNVDFKTKFVPTEKIFFLEKQKGLLNFISKEKPDYLVVMMDLHFLHVLMLGAINFLKLKIIWWGPWITDFSFANRVRLFFIRKYPSILYCEKHKIEFVNKGVNPEMLFVSNNTIGVTDRIESFKSKIKNAVLFVGSLNERKGLIETLEIFKDILDFIPKEIVLYLIGEGKMRLEIENFIQKNPRLKTRVILKGKITKSNQLNQFFNRSLISISLNQAGLSVLHSFANGVPFITLENSISGGEKWNIINNNNGYLCKNIEEFKNKLIFYINNPEICITMGEEAFKYYDNNASPQLMVSNFLKSYKYYN